MVVDATVVVVVAGTVVVVVVAGTVVVVVVAGTVVVVVVALVTTYDNYLLYFVYLFFITIFDVHFEISNDVNILTRLKNLLVNLTRHMTIRIAN